MRWAEPISAGRHSRGTASPGESSHVKYSLQNVPWHLPSAPKADVNRDGAVTLPELELYVPSRVSELSDGVQHPHVVAVQDFDPQTPLVRIA